jgi:hypothetical protein
MTKGHVDVDVEWPRKSGLEEESGKIDLPGRKFEN